MILRRFMQHVREQNWFAVCLDVIVVIVGIFLGLQVQTWYEEQGEREQERLFLNRMHTEVRETLGYQIELNSSYVFIENMRRTNGRLRELLEFLSGDRGIETLDRDHCTAIVTSHILFDTTVTLPTITELLSSGQFSIIRNDEIKRAVSEYLRANETLTLIVRHMEAVKLVMARKYPEFIEFDLTRLGLELRQGAEHKCDFAAMAQSNAFKNDIGDNASKFYGYLAAYSAKQEKLENIRAILERELGITREEDTQ